MVRLEGFEPPTIRVEAEYSSPLSYSRIYLYIKNEVSCIIHYTNASHFEIHCCGRRIPSDVVSRNQTFPIYTVLSTMYFKMETRLSLPQYLLQYCVSVAHDGFQHHGLWCKVFQITCKQWLDNCWRETRHKCGARLVKLHWRVAI